MSIQKYLIKDSLVTCFIGCCASLAPAGNPSSSTTDAVLSARGELLTIQKGTRHLSISSAGGKSLPHSSSFDKIPIRLFPDGDKTYATAFGKTDRLQALPLESGRTKSAIPAGSGACYPMFGPDKKHIRVCNQFNNSTAKVDLVMHKAVRSVRVLHEPKSVIPSKDGKHMFVTDFSFPQRADINVMAVRVSVIETDGFMGVRNVQPASDNNALREMYITPDGKYIYVFYNLGRFTVPASQLQ